MSTRAPDQGGPWRLTLVTNPDDCNLACPMCARGAPRNAGAPRRMPADLAARVLHERRGTPLSEVIPSTMGEPLLWSGLDSLVDLCREPGLALNVTTNGTFPGRRAEAWAARLVPVASDVKISWNGATARTAEAIMAGLSFEEAAANVRAFLAVRDALAGEGKRRCRVSFQVTAQEANVRELPNVVRLAAGMGVDRVKVNHVQPRVPGLEAESLRRSPEAIRRWNDAVAGMRAAAAEAALPSGGRVLLENVVPLSPDPASPAPRGPCRFVGREAWVHADGQFAPCPHPAAVAGELGRFGVVGERPLGEIWESDAFRSFVEHHEQHPVCRECPFRRPGGA